MVAHALRLVLIGLLALSSCQQATPESKLDWIISGAQIVDGSGNKPFYADLGIKDGKIAVISPTPLDPTRSNNILDAKGLFVCPGFIDLHTNITTNAQNLPLAENFIRQGTTSVLASLHSGDQPWPIDTYADTLRFAANIGFFAGHSWVRKRIMGLENRQASPEELDSMRFYVAASMQQGALGLATGLEYVPANYASEEEIVALAKVAAQYQGIYFTHMRNEMDEVMASIRESIAIGAKAGIPVEINHLKAAGKPQWGWSQQMLALLDSARAEGIDVTADVYPYMAYSTFSSILIPQWAMAGGREGLIERLKNPELREKIRAEMREIIMRDPGADDLSLIQFRDFPLDPAFKGKTLEDYARHLGKPLTLETTIDLMLEIETKGGFYGIFHAMNEDDLRNFIRHPLTMFDSDADLVVFGAEHPHPRCYGAFPRVLEKYVREEKLLTLEEAIHRMTALPAQRIGQSNRGLIQTGNYADLTLLDFQNVKDNATYTDPHHYPSGIEYVFVNGTLVLNKGEMTGQKPGMWLKGKFVAE